MCTGKRLLITRTGSEGANRVMEWNLPDDEATTIAGLAAAKEAAAIQFELDDIQRSRIMVQELG